MSTTKSFKDLPYHELIEIDHEKLSEEECRELVKVIQEQRSSAQARRSTSKKQEKKLTGKSIDIDGLL